MTLFGSLGSVCFKLYTSRKSVVILLAGLTFYGTGALLNIYLLNKLPYTIVVPANALTFIWALLFAKCFFNEPIRVYQMCGVGIIVLGLLILLLL